MVEEHAARAAADPMIGKVLNGRFRIIEKLGAGGMGTVYKAIQTPLDRMVALKILNSNYDSKRDPGFQRRFFLEASVTSKLKHPNTITVIDYGKTDDGIYYIAMEFVEGVTLAQVLAVEGPMPWNRVLYVAQQICRSLREAHRAGIIHRDLKPANVMICNEETDHDLVKVLDFGLVKSFLPDGPLSDPDEGQLTQAGVFLGSPQYMAPEQARNLADPRSDVYSLGVVLFQMLTGKPPFVAEQSIDVIVKHMKEAPPKMRDVLPGIDLPPDVEGLVMRCLDKDPDKRYQSMDDLLEAIRGAALGQGLSGVFSVTGVRTMQTPPPLNASQLPPSGAHSTSKSGPRQMAKSGPRAMPSSSGARQQLSKSSPTMSLDIVVDSGEQAAAAAAAGQNLFSADKPSGPRWLLPALLFVGAILIGGALVLFLGRAPEPAPVQPTPAQPTAHETRTPPPSTTPPSTAPVKFRVLSDPLGARVSLGNKSLGETPLEFDQRPGADGVAAAELTFSLDGYQRQTVTAAGSGPEVVINQKLRKKNAPPAVKTKQPKHNAPGYKEDPYQ